VRPEQIVLIQKSCNYIIFLSTLFLQKDDFSSFHVLNSDELWHFYYGRPITIYLIDPETGELEEANLGPRQEHHFTFLVPRGLQRGYWPYIKANLS